MDYEVLCHAKPVYEEMDGWQCSTQGICEYRQLPKNARRYVERLEKLLKVPIRFVSTGSKREDTIVRF
jgi:adenylosuccinate synthase